jgi:hypothetical protein
MAEAITLWVRIAAAPGPAADRRHQLIALPPPYDLPSGRGIGPEAFMPTLMPTEAVSVAAYPQSRGVNPVIRT